MSISTQTHIPILDLDPEIEMLKAEFNEAFNRVLKSGRFILGPEVERFEKAVASYLNVKHAVGLNSGTDALTIALRALNIGAGDEVIAPSFTFFATAESILSVGATIVFCDINEQTFNIDPNQIEKAITEKTKAIIPVHLYGRPAEMDAIMHIASKYDLKVIEDCAQSFGALYFKNGENASNELNKKRQEGQQTGSIGYSGAYSFFPSKNLGAFGDGGLFVTDDDAAAEQAMMLRAHGSLKKYHNSTVGYNSRLDSMQASFLQIKLKYVDAFNENRRKAAHRYITALSALDEIIMPGLPDAGHVYHQFTVRVLHAKRDELMEALQKNNIDTMIYYPIPCHKLPVLADTYGDMHLPVTNRLTEEVLSLPIGPFLGESDQDRVIETIKSVLK